MKIRSGGLDLLLSIYRKTKSRFDDSPPLLFYQEGQWKINIPFFIQIIYELSCQEKNLMKKHHESLLLSYSGHLPFRHSLSLEKLSISEKQNSIFEHVSIFHPLHPLRPEYSSVLESIHFPSLPIHQWKHEYYIMLPNHKDHPSIRHRMVQKYIQSLLFTMSYYLDDCPSWSWGYTFDIPPLFSDIYSILSSRKDDSLFVFPNKTGDHLSYQEQLAIIIPHEQQTQIFPISFVRKLRQCPNYSYHYPYHKNVALNVWHGNKYIYSETLLSCIFEDMNAMTYIRHISSGTNKE
jgi:5'-3' exonuclease